MCCRCKGRRHGAFVAHLRFPCQIAGDVIAQLRRAWGECSFRVGDAGELAVVDGNQLRRILRRGGAVGDDHGDGFADKPHAAMRQHRALGRARLHAVLADEGHGMRRGVIAGTHGVLAREHLFHAGEGARWCRVHSSDFRVCAVGAHEMRVQLPGRIPVGGVAAGAGYQTVIFDAAAIVGVGVIAHGCFAPACCLDVI